MEEEGETECPDIGALPSDKKRELMFDNAENCLRLAV